MIYLSGPMSGIPDYNYPLFNRAAKSLRNIGLDIANPAEIKKNPALSNFDEEGIWAYYMTEALKLQLTCDAWAGLEGWTKSRGALREFNIAVDLRHKLFLVKKYPIGFGLVPIF